MPKGKPLPHGAGPGRTPLLPQMADMKPGDEIFIPGEEGKRIRGLRDYQKKLNPEKKITTKTVWMFKHGVKWIPAPRRDPNATVGVMIRRIK